MKVIDEACNVDPSVLDKVGPLKLPAGGSCVIAPVPYGHELALDLHNCDVTRFAYLSVRDFCCHLCEVIGMERCEFNYIESEEGDEPDLKTHGFSACQFIVTSSITMHGLDLTGSLYVNVFSCAPFDAEATEAEVVSWFGGHVVKSLLSERL